MSYNKDIKDYETVACFRNTHPVYRAIIICGKVFGAYVLSFCCKLKKKNLKNHPAPPHKMTTKILWKRIKKGGRKYPGQNIGQCIMHKTWTVFGIYTDLLRISSL